MTNDTPTAYIGATADAACLHTTPDCPQLSGAISINTTDPLTDTERSWCGACRSEARPSTYHPPETTPCPCGAGHAERVHASGNRGHVEHYYRHRGCPYGGTVVVVNGALCRRVGPVFQPARYGVGGVEAAGGAVGVSAGD